MTTALAWLAVALGALAGMVASMTLVGWLLPRQHVASRTLLLPVAPEVVWATLVDYPGQRFWRKGLTAVDRQPDRDGAEVWRESFGRNAVAFQTLESNPPSRLVRRIDDERGPFRGRWEFSVEPLVGPGSSRVSLTEHGEIANPIFRFINRFATGQATTLESYLKDLAAKFGVDPRFIPPDAINTRRR